jgi:predicted transcriptional regulator
MLQGEAIGTAKLSAAEVIEIRANEQGLKGYELAVLYGVSQAQISRIRSGTRWEHLA